MREISAKEIKFAEGYIQTGGDISKAAVLAGYSPNNALIAGKRLWKRDRVQSKLKELQEQVKATYEYTRDQMLRELEDVIQRAASEDYPNYAAILKAMEMRGKMLGYFETEVQQVSNYDVSIKVLDSTPAPPVPLITEGGI